MLMPLRHAAYSLIDFRDYVSTLSPPAFIASAFFTTPSHSDHLSRDAAVLFYAAAAFYAYLRHFRCLDYALLY